MLECFFPTGNSDDVIPQLNFFEWFSLPPLNPSTRNYGLLFWLRDQFQAKEKDWCVLQKEDI